jgi:hypothetical protein
VKLCPEIRCRDIAESRDFHTLPLRSQSGRRQASEASATEKIKNKSKNCEKVFTYM